MDSDQIQFNINILIDLSGSMLAAAKCGDWEQVQEIEQQRKKILDQTFPLNTDAIKDASALADQIHKIADFDKETMRLAEDSRKELSELANKISSGRHAVNAYRDIASR